MGVTSSVASTAVVGVGVGEAFLSTSSRSSVLQTKFNRTTFFGGGGGKKCIRTFILSLFLSLSLSRTHTHADTHFLSLFLSSLPILGLQLPHSIYKNELKQEI